MNHIVHFCQYIRAVKASGRLHVNNQPLVANHASNFSGKNFQVRGFVDHAETIRAKGVDEIACMSVNDVFVMTAWGKSAGVDGKVTMLADGNGAFAKALGLEMDASGFGMGTRSKRFSMIVDDGKVTELNVEAPGAFQVSSAEHMLGQL